ncbi:MAG TPA: GNAT family N-acetyltransferase [Chlamydiales bacterium]|nr:GNAT family N-acetyltransferase [Chlamydiales bacterium]
MTAYTPFQWPTLYTREIGPHDDLQSYQQIFHQWDKICDEKLAQVPCNSIFCRGKARTIFDTLWAIQHFMPHARKTFTPAEIQQHKCYAVFDGKGKMQGLGILKEKADAIFIDTLTTSPENIALSSSDKKVSGVGRLLMKRIVHDLIQKKTKKPIHLVPTKISISFYKKLGFQGDPMKECLFVTADTFQELYDRSSNKLPPSPPAKVTLSKLILLWYNLWNTFW